MFCFGWVGKPICEERMKIIRVRMILVLDYWVLGNIHRYWIVLLLGDIFGCADTQYNTNQTAGTLSTYQ